MNGSRIDRQSLHDELEEARAASATLVAEATTADLRRPSEGTRCTNQQLRFHMLFGYLIVRTLLRLVRTFGRFPDRSSRVFAAVLNAGTRPFRAVNYVGCCGGAVVFRGPRLVAKFDRTIASLHPTKWGLHCWSESLRQELLPDVRVTLVEPGVVATELPDHITHDETRQGVQQLYSQAEVTADDIAEVIGFALSRPRHLAINEILLRPAAQL